MLNRGDLLVVDEAGMLDQDTARALLEIAHECQARVAFVGDRHQLPAVGRGGVLDLAAQHAGTDAIVSLDVVHRFADPAYAELSVAMRRGEPVFDDLRARGQIRLHASEPERTHALAAEAADALLAGHTSRALMADTREQVAALNSAIRDRLVSAGLVDDGRVVMNETGERLGVGDRVATRRNDWQFGVANRQTWTITELREETVTLRNDHGQTRDLPAWYAQGWVELAYATTVYGAQGDTTAVGQLVMTESTSAASAYVGMTRGRHDNVAHLVAETPEHAQAIWDAAFSRDRADLGVAHARLQAIDDIDRLRPHRSRPSPRTGEGGRARQAAASGGQPSRVRALAYDGICLVARPVTGCPRHRLLTTVRPRRADERPVSTPPRNFLNFRTGDALTSTNACARPIARVSPVPGRAHSGGAFFGAPPEQH